MIRIKLEKKNNNIIFKLKIDEKDKKNIIFKRVLMEAKVLKNSRYSYEVPLRFFLPILSNVDKDEIVFDKYSVLSYFEFSDCYDEKYYASIQATPQFMKKWREEDCPKIYKITINKDEKLFEKEVVFKRPIAKIRI